MEKKQMEISEAAKKEAVAIATAYGKIDKRAIDWRVAREREGFNSRQLALAFHWPVSLINSTDARTKCALYGKLGDKPELETLTAAEAAGVIKELGGMKAASEVDDANRFTEALARFRADKTAAKGDGKPASDKAGGMSADERVLAAIAANIAGMTAAGKAAAIAALS